MSTIINYLTEDPVIPSQRYALISIVGPNMSQKCDVWGMKIRGVTETIEAAKELSKKIMRVDNIYDIYTVDIGKFFPLNVSSDQIKDVEYQNQQLNDLMKSYNENKEKAEELWAIRKNEMVKEAIKDGTKEGQKELEEKAKLVNPDIVKQKIQELEKELQEQRQLLNDLL
jgi:flagellar biosynthesis/type III secretory pathway protein FliH